VSGTVTRAVAIVAGAVGAAVAGVELVREVVLALNSQVTWPYPAWWGWLTDTTGVRPAIAAAVAGVGALACFAVALRLLRRPRTPLHKLELGEENAGLRLEASTLDRLLAKALRRRLKVLEGAKVWLYRTDDERYEARAVVQLRACCDLPDLQARIRDTVRDELRTATGLEVERVDADVEKFDLKLKGGS
jgi:hypothetical protein